MIIVREYEVFPDYALKEEETKGLSGNALRKMRAEKLDKLRKALQEGKDTIQSTCMYFVSLPTNGAHKGHKCGQESGMAQRMHPMVSQKITLLVREGATNPQEVRRALREYVRSELKENCPSPTNRSYFPTLEDIRNHIYTAKQGLEFSKLDQDNLSAKIKNWKEQNSTVSHFFRPYLKEEATESLTQSLLWIHQEEWQKELMCKYGNCISLIDATYKTMQYDLPLFLVCVRTNVGYCTVAEFVTQSETAEAIGEALKILREWNPGWNPPFVLCDYSEAEISAIKATFDSVRVYICDFHREQAWTRWANNSQNGLSKPEAEILLSLLRKCAWAPSKNDEADANYTEAVKLLQASEVWRQHENVRSWLLSTWLNISEVSRAYMYMHTIVVTMVTKMIDVSHTQTKI